MLLLIHCFMYLSLFVGVLCLVFVLVFDEEERADCFALIVFLMPWVGLQCVIVVFPDHTHLHFKMHVKVDALSIHSQN